MLRNFAFTHKTFHVLSKKYCVPLENFAFARNAFRALSQKYCIPQETLHLPPKRFVCLRKTITFPRETLQLLAKALKYSCSSHLILQYFHHKSFASKRKPSPGNAEVL